MIIQILIVLFSCSAIYLVSQKHKYAKWGYLIGFIGQPLWLYTSFVTEQWGIFILSLFYMYSWGIGIYNYCLIDIKNAFKKYFRIVER